MSDLKLTFLGYFWPKNGDLFYMTRGEGADKREARVLVDSLGELWVDIRRKPEGGFFCSEPVDSYRSFKKPSDLEAELREQGFDHKRIAHGAIERGVEPRD